jgi:carboxymethylenebutenolidase
MCHDHDSRPPAPPRSGDVAERGTLTLTSADGTAFSAAYAAPAQEPRVGVVVLPDIRGLFRFYEELAERFAAAGPPAIAFDYFGRTAGLGPRDERFEYMPHVQQVRQDTFFADIRAALDALRSGAGAERSTFVLGFCFGGSHSWRQAGGDLDLAGCAGFYGRPAMVGDAAQHARKPTLMLIAGADQATPVEDQLALAETMRSAGAEVETAVYDGAPHSFFDRAFGEWEEACADAWRRMLALADRVAA